MLINLPGFHRLQHRATRFCVVAAIREGALWHVGDNVWEVSINLFRFQIEERQRADARCIGDPAADLQRDHLCDGGRVPALAGCFADGFHLPSQSRLQRVEQAGLAHARRPDKRRDFASQLLAQGFDAGAAARAGVEHRIANPFVDGEAPAGVGFGDEICLVGADQHGDALPFSAYEQPI